MAQLEKMGVRNMAEYEAKRDKIRSHINFVMFLGTGFEPDEEFEAATERKKE
ncbi:hypothetical protein [Clostridium sp. M62/1]|uniref:hypothetical protein n=1 Tax=Clostridium sp. M62/1 TaxID=411486 RepID=UPI001A9825CB|nr:hypothetical protein [Clostridium sp. M62/1]